MPPSTSTVIGTKRQRQFNDDVHGQQFRNKRQKLTGSSIVGTCLTSPTAPSRCTPIPFPSNYQGGQEEENSPARKEEQDVDGSSAKRERNVGAKQQPASLEQIGPYRLLAYCDDSPDLFTAVDTRRNGQLVLCRRLDRAKYAHMMQLSHRLQTDLKTVSVEEEEENNRAYEQIFPATSEVIVGDSGHYYYFEPRHYGSLHSLVAERKRLNEQECLWYFRQIVHLLVYCHRRGVILRDLKLRKFVFVDPERTTIRLDGVDELFVCPSKQEGNGDECTDRIADRHGCPAYVGPEILDLNQKTYSGRAADMWSLGVLLFVTLYGRYPFYDKTPARLFAKIRHGNIHIAEETGVSFEARTLIRYLLKRDPQQRPSAMETLAHPWLQSKVGSSCKSRRPVCGPVFASGAVVINSATGIRYQFGDRNVDSDQCVPCVAGNSKHGNTNTTAFRTKEGRFVDHAATVPDL